jgi:hypothetical protein
MQFKEDKKSGGELLELRLLDSVEQLTLIFFATVKCKSSIFFI